MALSITHFVDALARSKFFQLHLLPKEGKFIFIKKREEWDILECGWFTSHRSPREMRKAGSEAGKRIPQSIGD
jgi:hypothetical protein